MFDVKIEGLQELNKVIKEVIQSVDPDKVEPILFKGAGIITRAAKARTPMGPTGNLKKAIRTKRLKRYGKNPAPVIAAVDRKRAPHAHLVEYGTGVRVAKSGKYKGKSFGTMPAQPFWRPAVDEKQGEVTKYVVKGLKGLIEGAVK